MSAEEASPPRLGTPLANHLIAMKISRQTTHSLRLVNAESPSAASPLRVSHAANIPPDRSLDQARARRVAAENQHACGLSALDARWIFAVQVAQSLDGGRAAILVPERRQSLVAAAQQLGLRAFDASLVIAVVQDGVRTGEGALGHEVEARLKLVRPVPPAPAFSVAWARLMISGVTVLAGVGVFFFLINWLRQGAGG